MNSWFVALRVMAMNWRWFTAALRMKHEVDIKDTHELQWASSKMAYNNRYMPSSLIILGHSLTHS